MSNNFMNRVKRGVRRRTYQFFLNNFQDMLPNRRSYNLLDYNNACLERPPVIGEKYYGNMLYGLGYVLRHYSGYTGSIWCATEHATPLFWKENYWETRDNDMPVLLVHSEERRKFLSAYTNKLMLPIGLNYSMYVDEYINSEYFVKQIKGNLGKTLVVFPVHNGTERGYVNYMEEMRSFISMTQDIAKKGNFDTVLISLYYADIELGMASFYEKEGFQVVCNGRNTNYDFPIYLNSILLLADYVITQSHTTLASTVYRRIPTLFSASLRKSVGKSGDVLIAGEESDGTNFMDITERELLKYFGSYSDKGLSDAQYAWASKMWGYDQKKTPEEMCLIFEYADDIRKHPDDIRYLKKVAERKKYVKIRSYLSEAIAVKARGKQKVR